MGRGQGGRSLGVQGEKSLQEAGEERIGWMPKVAGTGRNRKRKMFYNNNLEVWKRRDWEYKVQGVGSSDPLLIRPPPTHKHTHINTPR